MKPTLTATIVQGAKTNRVRVKRSHNRQTTERQPQRALARYKRDPEVQGLVTVAVCICMPTEELAALDAICERVGMARSHLIRQAIRQYAAKVESNPEQEKRWKEALR